MPRAPRIPRAQVIALHEPDPMLGSWRDILLAAISVLGLGAALLG